MICTLSSQRTACAHGAHQSAILSRCAYGNTGPVGSGDGPQSQPLQGRPESPSGDGVLRRHAGIHWPTQCARGAYAVSLANGGRVGVRRSRRFDDSVLLWRRSPSVGGVCLVRRECSWPDPPGWHTAAECLGPIRHAWQRVGVGAGLVWPLYLQTLQSILQALRQTRSGWYEAGAGAMTPAAAGRRLATAGRPATATAALASVW